MERNVGGGFWWWKEALRAATPLEMQPKPLNGDGGGREGQNERV